jgi:HAD superfamily hydrolase (TIGR01549 family)
VTIRAVLFDVGGPIAMELEHERAIDADIRSLFAEQRMPISDEQYAAAWREAIDEFAPNAYSAVIYKLAAGDEEIAPSVWREMSRRSHERGSFELRPGIPELLAESASRGLKLGLAANQPAEVIGRLEAHGIAKYFASTDVSGHHGFHKPDVRLFLHACEALGVEPAECIMVGDRIDCDIVPARQLGMRTVRLRTGRHATQEPRTEDERPEVEVTDVAGMREAILRMLD